MMKQNLFYIFLILFVVACEKNDEEIFPDEVNPVEEEVFQNNYIKAQIGSRDLVIFEDNSLNDDTLNAFSFSFGQTITEFDDSDIVDTCISINGYLNREQLKISFPLNKEAKRYDIKRSFGPYSKIDGFYSNTIDFEKDEGFLTFETNNFLEEDIPESKVGEIVITKLDWEKREIEGSFTFNAYGYFHDWKETVTKISAADSMITVTEGAFYYHWSDELNIGYEK